MVLTPVFRGNKDKAAVGSQVDLIIFTRVEVRNGVCAVAGGKFEGVSVTSAAGQRVVAASANQRVVLQRRRPGYRCRYGH